MMESLLKWVENPDNVIGGLVPALIAILFSILLTSKSEESFFENSRDRLIFWIGSTFVSFISVIWTTKYTSVADHKVVTDTILTIPHIYPHSDRILIEQFYLSVPGVLIINYLLLILYYQFRRKSYKINPKEVYVMLFTSLLSVDYLHMKMYDLATIYNGIGGIGGGGYRDTLLVLPLGTYLFLVILKKAKELSDER